MFPEVIIIGDISVDISYKKKSVSINFQLRDRWGSGGGKCHFTKNISSEASNTTSRTLACIFLATGSYTRQYPV
eukprot:g34783.t1